MDTDRIDQSFAAKRKIFEQTAVRPTGAPQRQQSKVPPPRPPRAPWKAAVPAEKSPRVPGNEYDEIPASDQFTAQQTSGEYDRLPSSGEFDKPSASHPYDKMPTNAEYESMRANEPRHGKLPTKSELEAYANRAQVKPSNPYGKLPTKSELEARANGAENPYGRPIKVDPSKYAASPKSSPKSVEVETPLPKAQNTRQQVQLPETGHVATGQFVLATESLFIQKNEKDDLVHYNSDHFSSGARKIIAESVNNQVPVRVSTDKNELKVAPVQKL